MVNSKPVGFVGARNKEERSKSFISSSLNQNTLFLSRDISKRKTVGFISVTESESVKLSNSLKSIEGDD